jgi:hypothetical protein
MIPGLADFTPGLQESLIQSRGAIMVHEIAISCTCRVEDTYAGIKGDGKERRRDAFCPRCRGDGWLYRAPRTLVGLATSIRQQKNILDVGIAQPGDMMFSPSTDAGCRPPASNRIGNWDLLTATWDQPLDDGHVLVRGAGTSAENLGLRTDLSPDEDRLWYEPKSAVWCEDEFGTVFSEGADFVLGPGKIIKWVGNRPIRGKRYTIKYNAYFEWVVFVPPQERRDRENADLGQLVFLRKRHVAMLNESPVAIPEDRIPLSSRIKC